MHMYDNMIFSNLISYIIYSIQNCVSFVFSINVLIYFAAPLLDPLGPSGFLGQRRVPLGLRVQGLGFGA